MHEPRSFEPAEPFETERETDEFETVLTTPADIESAGRSCMAILVLAAIIVLLLCVWIGYRAVGGGQ
jgi:hypothetical protein